MAQAGPIVGHGGYTQAGNRKPIQTVPKELFWDRAVAVLTKINFVVAAIGFVTQYFIEKTLICKASSDLNYDPVPYIDTYCHGNDEGGQYLFLVAHSLLAVVPHYLWYSAFGSQLKYFFALVRKIEKLRFLETPQCDPKTMDVVNKMEYQFPANQGKLFKTYRTKIVLQLIIMAVALLVNHVAFGGLSANYACPDGAETCMEDLHLEFQEAWPSTCSLRCLSRPSWTAHVLGTAITVSMFLKIIVLLYGLGWCFAGHPAELGAHKIATFGFASGLSLADHTFPSPPGVRSLQGLLLRLHSAMSPGISSDMDFLTVQLFHADRKHGSILKEWQVCRTQQTLWLRDYEQLYGMKYTWRFKDHSKQ